ncbi:ATP-binding protein [Roseibacillus ishigakijimensis]|uniref:ATP-binding protein n=1 Tax=Roseibacillus ishigakijimensis TaxID=454146 RepID=A0A934RPC8_9BACT|nr:ATP-binding protein [Roseibacillus ishigakijimensis]MBK1835537.1 ATP-binding protein [Roseibacillus ishigakijimensis]
MDPIRNPYSPGAGSPPPAFAGRDRLREQVHIAIERIRLGRTSKSVLMIGLRGVGKTVLLDHMRNRAEADGHYTIRIEAPEHRSLPGILAPQLRQTLIKLSRLEKAKSLAQRALRALAGFAKLKVKYDDLEVGLDFDPEPGLADNGDLESDLQDLLVAVGQAAQAAESSFILFIDELQYVPEEQLSHLISALHKIAQLSLPVTLVGAGLPQLTGQMGKAKSYAERLFDFPFIGALEPEQAREALVLPAEEEGVAFQPEALDYLISQTQGYPYFLQEWGKHSWDIATASPITLADCQQATASATAALDASFFRVRFDRLTPLEKKYLRAMAELGSGPHRSGDIADILDRTSQSLAPTRAKLIAKGMVWSPSHGDTAFTVPLFDQYMKRIMPQFELN